MRSNSNGHRIVWYLLSILTAIVLSITGAWALQINADSRHANARISTLEGQYQEINTKLDLLLAVHDLSAKPRK